VNPRQKRARNGSIAGSVFAVALALANKQGSRGATTKAVYAISRRLFEKQMQLAASFAQGSRSKAAKVPNNEDHVRKVWEEYGDAAHLWCAYIELLNAEYLPEDARSDQEKLSRIYTLIICADELLSRAELLGLKCGRDPWRLPVGFPRKKKVTLSISSPDRDLYDILKNYEPKHRK
jgi:hypothetical protein